MADFDPELLKNLFKPINGLGKKEIGQVTIIGGSTLFHGAPLLSLKVASRICGMVYFSSPEKSLAEVSARIKSSLSSFIWVPFSEVGDYIKKSDAVLIGPGLMRYKKEKDGITKNLFDKSYKLSAKVCKKLLLSYPDKRWVIDAGALQVIDKSWIPEGSVLTPNSQEYQHLFGDLQVKQAAKKHKCIIVYKSPVAKVCGQNKCTDIKNGNPGLIKGGTGDVQSGLTVALLAKNDPFLAAAAATYITKLAADKLYKKVGTNYNADDLADQVPEELYKLTE